MKAAEIERWNEAQALLDDVLEDPGPGTVAAARTRAATVGCINELEALLEALDTVSVLDAPLDDAISEIAAARMRHGALSGRVFGRWTLGEEIGRGGMSTVYLARRTGDGFEQQAALKILSLTFASQALIDSFLRERKILSELQHPGIARLIDGGVTPEGSPFLVMEYVEGLRIDHWCAEHDADATAIVRRVEALARAVAHAQRMLVIHRDINAANVLINRRGEPVLIDFGIAGLLDSDRGQTLHAFTPTFAAPEQIAGALCTTATDVYAIGRLLETLLPEGTADNDLRLLIDVATAEDPEQRYANARNLAEDLQAWLEKRPMRARPPSLHYRTARFVARHRWGVAAGVLALLSMAGGFTASLWQAHIAAAERDLAQIESARATQVTEFLKDLFRASDPDRARGEAVTARELLDQGAYQAGNAFKGTPELKSEMLVLLGDLNLELGETEAAAPLLEEGLRLADEFGDLELQVSARRASALHRMETGAHAEALALAEQAEQLLQRADAVPGSLHATLLRPILFSLAELGQVPEAVERGRAALTAARASATLSDDALYNYLFSVGNVLLIAEQEEAALELFFEAADIAPRITSLPSMQIALHSDISGVMNRRGDLTAAIDHRRQAMALVDEIYPPNHPERARMLSNLGATLSSMGQYREAEDVLREALAIYEQIYVGEAHPRVAAAHNNLGRALEEAGEYAAAEPHLARAWELAAQLFGENDPRYVVATGNLGNLHRLLGEYERAEELLLRNLELRRSLLGPEHRAVGAGIGLLCALRLEQEQWHDALRLCDEALELFQKINYTNARQLIAILTRRAQALAGLGRTDAAQATFAEARLLSDTAGADAGKLRLDLLAAHAEYLLERADPEAQAAIEEALEAHVETLGASHPDTQRLVALSRAGR